MSVLSNLTHSEGDPDVVSTGPSSLSATDSLARGLGWFSLGLGLAELLAADKIAEALGMQGQESLIRAYGAREIGSGMLTLSVDSQVGLMSRVAGDMLDIATLLPAMREDNPKRGNVGFALAMVVGVTALDMIAAQTSSARHSRGSATPRYYGDRTGFPDGVAEARGAARHQVEESNPPQRRPEIMLGGGSRPHTPGAIPTH